MEFRWPTRASKSPAVRTARICAGRCATHCFWSVGTISQLNAINLPRAQEIGVDLRALGFALFVSVITGLVMGLVPALQISRPDLNDTLKEGARGSAAGRRSQVCGALIASEVALSLVLLIGAGLLLNSFVRISFLPPVINP